MGKDKASIEARLRPRAWLSKKYLPKNLGARSKTFLTRFKSFVASARQDFVS